MRATDRLSQKDEIGPRTQKRMRGFFRFSVLFSHLSSLKRHQSLISPEGDPPMKPRQPNPSARREEHDERDPDAFPMRPNLPDVQEVLRNVREEWLDRLAPKTFA